MHLKARPYLVQKIIMFIFLDVKITFIWHFQKKYFQLSRKSYNKVNKVDLKTRQI